MSMVEHSLISKIINEQNYFIVNKYGITSDDFTELKDAFRFVKDYAHRHGSTPSFETMVEKFEDFDYQPEVVEVFPFLCESLKEATRKRRYFDLLQGQASEQWGKLSPNKFGDWLQQEVLRIQDETGTHNSQGTNFATNGQERLAMYEERKAQGSGKFIPTPYPTLTEYLAGGMELGDYVLLQAYTNRGKSFICSDMGLCAWDNGFGVLHYSPELSQEQQLNRLDSLYGHYSLRGLRNGDEELTSPLEDDQEKYEEYVKKFNPHNATTPYIVKTMKDLPQGLTVDLIESDLRNNPNVKFVIIDGFNLMTHVGREGTRNNMSMTSRQLRQVFGRNEVTGLVVHQSPTKAEKDNKESDELGQRMPKPPLISDYSETIAVVQDAATVLSFDHHNGIGQILLAKSRVGNVDGVVDLHTNFDYGYINEAPVGRKLETDKEKREEEEFLNI